MTVLVLALLTSLGRVCLVSADSRLLPRCPAPDGASRSSSVLAARALALRLAPDLASYHSYLAADIPKAPTPMRIVVCAAGVSDDLPTVPDHAWLPAHDLADSPDAFAIACGVAVPGY